MKRLSIGIILFSIGIFECSKTGALKERNNPLDPNSDGYIASATNGGGTGSTNGNEMIEPPGNLAVQGLNARIVIMWDDVIGASGYNIYWTGNGTDPRESGANIVSVTSNEYTHRNLVNNNEYRYSVCATNEFVESELSSIVLCEPFPPVVGNYPLLDVARGIYVLDDFVYIANGSRGLRIIDVSDRSYPHEVGYCASPGVAFSVFVKDGYAFLADNDSLRIIDVSDKAQPVEEGFFVIVSARDVCVVGDYAYVTSRYKGLRIINIANKASPYEEGYFDGTGIADHVFVEGNYAYVGISTDVPSTNSGLSILDISDKSNPVEVAFWVGPQSPQNILVSAGRAYIPGSPGLRIIDVSDAFNPYEVGYINPDPVADAYVVGNMVYIALVSYGIHIYDIAQLNSPIIYAKCDTVSMVVRLFVDGDYIYTIGYSPGLNIVDIRR